MVCEVNIVEETIIMKEEDVKSLICKIPGILSCKVIMSTDNKIDELHVLCAQGKNTKQMVRDIQSAVNAKFDTDIDYKVISIAQIDIENFRESRLKISGITLTNVGNTIKTVVSLEHDGQLYEGTSTKIKSQTNKYKAIAEATIASIENFISLKDVFYLEGIEKKRIITEEAFLSIVGYTYKESNNIFCGCCLIKSDENEAIAKSILDAINRIIGTIV